MSGTTGGGGTAGLVSTGGGVIAVLLPKSGGLVGRDGVAELVSVPPSLR